MTIEQKKVKTLLFFVEVFFIAALLVAWVSFPSLQKNKSLWILFFYSLPSEFLIAAVPHEPVIIYFGKFYSPLTVALVAVVSTVATEALNYSAYKYIAGLAVFKNVVDNKGVRKIIRLFEKVPFLALLAAGVSPVPFYPFRILVVMARYPEAKYLLAVFLSRFPRFIFLAGIGHIFKIPDYVIIGIVVVSIVAIDISVVRNLLKKRAQKKASQSLAS
jgi:membrane protein YqaA with SNARE-associated domain